MTGNEFLLPIVIIGVGIVGIIAVVLSKRRSKKRRYLRDEPDAFRTPPRHRLDYQPKTRPMPAIQPTVRSIPPKRTTDAPPPKDIDLITSRKDITESLAALEWKYSLNNFTIATADGLIFGSSGGDTAKTDAAIYSELFRNNPLVETPGVVMFGMTHKGSDLIGIIRTETPLPGEIVQKISEDTKGILNVWV
jgi:hypothetical protein